MRLLLILAGLMVCVLDARTAAADHILWQSPTDAFLAGSIQRIIASPIQSLRVNSTGGTATGDL